MQTKKWTILPLLCCLWYFFSSFFGRFSPPFFCKGGEMGRWLRVKVSSYTLVAVIWTIIEGVDLNLRHEPELSVCQSCRPTSLFSLSPSPSSFLPSPLIPTLQCRLHISKTLSLRSSLTYFAMSSMMSVLAASASKLVIGRKMGSAAYSATWPGSGNSGCNKVRSAREWKLASLV